MQLVQAYLTRRDFAMEPARAVYIFMKYNNIDFETHVVSVLKGKYLIIYLINSQKHENTFINS